MAASVAIIREDRMLLIREKRGRASKLSLPGGKAQPGETYGMTASREAYEETGRQLSELTRWAITNIAKWTECAPARQHVGVLYLTEDDPDTTVHGRFNRTLANDNPRSKTVIEGLEWHPLDLVRNYAWRREHMHFHGDHLARMACAAM